MKYIVLLLLIGSTSSCTGNKSSHLSAQPKRRYNPEAVRLSRLAADTVIHSFNDKDLLAVAIDLLDKAISIDSNYFYAYQRKIIFETELKRYNQALLTSKQMLRLRPTRADLMATTGFMYEITGDTLSSKIYFKNSLLVFNKILDTINVTNKGYKTVLMGKATDLVMLGQQKQGDEITKKLYDDESDPSFKEYYKEFINISKKEWLNKIENPQPIVVSENPNKKK